MDPPGITRHRRPFLAPLWLTLLAVLIAAGVAISAYRGVTTSIVVLASVGEKDPGTIDDPPITAEGEQRAQRLAQLFAAGAGPGRLDALYVSGERRAQQTAAPLAERTHLAPNTFAVQEASATAAGLLRNREGTAVLVVAGGTAVQQFLRQLTGTAGAADAASEPDLLYIVSVPTVGRPHVLRLKY
ncbi:MAG TPA: phosphoglycerate mutase family protein [Steroidobacteraceae bacterium]|nr:phosphoglycerate mutase family protein [Steroidobacteraceae bacterium]